ncbi:efflux RND transporter periplasmic adaptor subunit [Lunatimonas salinarum]|uniref:efflux RND transporter periplasmic adaptor subunit n=1 Tax=Lunatimonas salinarum TaxID=1774590 RepID=UPI001ADECA89|nr:efflux RND transporter periplasmic adaptor subunit [Lunatimonas salinarum]
MNDKKSMLIILFGTLLLGAVAGYLIRGGGGASHEHEHLPIGESNVTYTCSMHPQIRQGEPGKCPLCGMALTPVGDERTGVSSPFVVEMTPEAVALSNVQTTEVRYGSGPGKLSLTGKIQFNEQRIKTLAANYSGRVDQLFVNFTGQEISAGQKLATLYSPDLVNAQKELLETAKRRDSQPMLYQAAKEKLRLWKISEEQIVALENSSQVQTQFDVLADVAGVVIAKNIAVGDFVTRGTTLVEIVDLSVVWIVLDAYESDLGAIRKGDELSFTVSAYPGRNYKAKVTYIDPVLNPDTRTVGIRAEAVNRNFDLKPGMFVSANIETSQKGSSELMVPKTAILWTGPRSVLYVQVGSKDAPAFEMREVVLGARQGDAYLILSGLEEGERVVSHGLFAIDAAAQLRGNYSMMTRPEAKTDTPDAFRRQLSAFVEAYLLIKEALVETDPQSTQAAVVPAMSSLDKMDKELLEIKSQDKWVALWKPMQHSLEQIRRVVDVEDQRKHFEVLSNKLIEAVEYFGLVDNSLYLQYCPMAFRDQGAYWLSAEMDVRNPYYGDKMLVCGEVKEVYFPENSASTPAVSSFNQ